VEGEDHGEAGNAGLSKRLWKKQTPEKRKLRWDWKGDEKD